MHSILVLLLQCSFYSVLFSTLYPYSSRDKIFEQKWKIFSKILVTKQKLQQITLAQDLLQNLQPLTKSYISDKKGTETETTIIWNDPLEINLVRHARKKHEDHQKYQIDSPDDNYQWELVEITKRDGLKAAYYLGIHFYYKYENSKNTPLIYVSPFRRCIQTAIPTAKALKTKIRIEYGLFESFHGFPTKEEIKEFYAGNEEYIDTEYESNYFIDNGSMYDLTQNKNKSTHRLLKYKKHQQMAEYLKEVQLKENRDIIVVSHQEEMYEIGNLLVNPDITSDSGKWTLEKSKWDTGTLIPFYKKKDGNYEESKERYEGTKKYELRTDKIEEFEEKHGKMEEFVSSATHFLEKLEISDTK